MLERTVKQSNDLWNADLSEESLIALGQWMASNIEKRPLSPQEIAQIQDSLSYPFSMGGIQVTDDITPLSYSIATDVGIYLGEVLKRNKPSLRWSQNLSNKNAMSYGEPLLTDSNSDLPQHKKVKCMPISTAISIAWRISEGKFDGSELHSFYKHWISK